ncbi:MAG: amino acid adenylation domain-containing protein [Candidatus Promineifilaceae bacterium]
MTVFEENGSPLSYNQRAVWLLHQLNPQYTAYNIGFTSRIQSGLDSRAFEVTFQRLTKRHPILRMRYRSVSGQPRQFYGPDTADFCVVDIDGLDDEDVDHVVRQELETPFDLSTDPPVRFRLYERGTQESILQVIFDHIAVDGWSIWQFLDELSTGYQAHIQEKIPTFPRLRANYTEFVAWQQEYLAGEEGTKAEAFWREQLGDNLPILDLPTDFRRPKTRLLSRDKYRIYIDGEPLDQLRELARIENVTPYVVTLAAFQSFLHRYTSQEKIMVGTPVFGRTRRFAHTLGNITNTMILRGDVTGEETFRELIHRTDEVVRAALAHQHYPFLLLVEQLRPNRDLSQTPLIQVLFNYLRPPRRHRAIVAQTSGISKGQLPKFAGFDVHDTSIHIGRQGGQFDLNLEILDVEDMLVATLGYDSGLFTEATAARMVAHFKTLLADGVANPEKQVGRLRLYTVAEEEQYHQWHTVQAISSRHHTLHQWFAEETATHPDQIAVRDNAQTLTFGELDRFANKLAHSLLAQGIQTGEIVGIYQERNVNLLAAVLAVLKTGAAYLPLDPDLNMERINYMIEASGVRFILTNETFSPDNEWPADIQFLKLEPEQSAQGQPTTPPQSTTDPESTIYHIYTSGSTGRPKGIQIKHRNVVNFLEAMQQTPGLKPTDRLLAITTLAFDISVLELFLPLVSGSQLLIADREVVKDGERLLAMVQREKITVLQATPTTWALLIAAGWQKEDTPHLRLALCGGDQLSPELASEILERDVELWNLYGPTETTVWSSAEQIQPGAAKITIGHPLRNTQLHILDASLNPLPVGVVGELYIGGDGVGGGYPNQPGLTASRFLPDPFSAESGHLLYKTGDLARLLADGRVEFLGRTDFQVKIRGFRVELGEIENVLQQHPNVALCVVVGHEEADSAKRLIAYVVAQEPEQPPSARTLRHFLQERLPAYMVPVAFILLETMPMTANRKIDRRALPSPTISESAVSEDSNLSTIEAAIAGIWKEILYIDSAERQDNFFELGGHSLLATQLASRIENTLGVSLPLKTIFANPTVAEMAEVVGDYRRSSTMTAVPPIKPISRDRIIPLSYAQERMWFLHQLAPDNAAYHIPLAVRINRPVNPDILDKAIDALAARHESLRTIFPAEDGVARQEILPKYKPEFYVVDLQDMASSEQETAAIRLIQADLPHPFALKEAPPWRASLFQLAKDDFILYMLFHHIIFDQWSGMVLWQELLTQYDALEQGEFLSLPPLAIQYADFAVWQREWLQGERLNSLLEYWRKQLAELVVLDLPTDRPRPPVQSYHGKEEILILNKDVVEALHALTHEEQLSPFMLMLAVFNFLLYRYTKQSDIAVGVPIANRHRLSVEPIIGTFVNTLVIRSNLSGDPTFADALRHVRDVLLEAYTHQELPFEQLVSEIVTNRDLSRTPLVQVFFNMINTPLNKDVSNAHPLSLLQFERGAAQFDLSLTVVLEEQLVEPRIVVEYNTDLFDRATIRQMLAHFEQLLRGVLAEPTRPLSSYEILTTAEREQLLTKWNETTIDFPNNQCLHEIFAAQAKKTPEKTAVIFGNHSITYRQLDEKSNQLAHYLKKLGVGPETVVGLFMERTERLIVGLLGILKAGGAYLPLDPGFPLDRLSFMVVDASVTVLLTEKALKTLPLVEQVETAVWLDNDWPIIEAETTAPLSASVNPSNRAYLIYTSGSTGLPKGVQIEHHSAVNFLTTMQQTPGIEADDILLSVTTLSFDISILEIFLPLISGAQLVLVDRVKAAEGRTLVQKIRQHRATMMQATPTTWTMVLEAGLEGETTLNKLLCGGEAMSPTLAQNLLEQLDGIELWNMYGPTETTIWSSTIQIMADTRKISIGRPIGNTTFYVLDDQHRPVPVGVAGELFIGGEGVARGYLNRPSLTAERFIPSPFISGERLYRTGDQVRYRADGTVEYLGRLDFQVKFHGHRIELGEIETTLNSHPDIRETVVTIQQIGIDQQLVAYLIPSNIDYKPTLSEIRVYLRSHLPAYMIPTRYVYLKSFPLTPNRKIDRKALPAPDAYRPELGNNYFAPRNDTEQVLADIMADLLNLDNVGVTDNFFELGGHSLQATRYVARVSQAFRMDLPLWTFLQSPRVADLTAQLLARPEDASRISRIAQLRVKMASLSTTQVQEILQHKGSL